MIDRQRLLAALVLLVMALFVASGYGPAARWRGLLRAAAVLLFSAAMVAALIELALWWSRSGP